MTQTLLQWHFYHKEALLGLCRCYREKDDFIKAMEFVSTAMSKDSSPMYFITIKHRDAFAIEIASIQVKLIDFCLNMVCILNRMMQSSWPLVK